MKPKELQLTNIGPFNGVHTVRFDTLGSIFLIYGETGAGKTTLFDALSYAFYGKPLGGRAGITKSLKSHFAPDYEAASVVLSFYIGTALYRITRVLPYIKQNNKNETPEEVSLEQYCADEWKNLSATNKTETEKYIKSLIKLSDKEFSRIVLLPQGEFSQFLRANSTEKKDTLLNLFPLNRYTAVMNAAKNRATDLKAAVHAIEKNIESICTAFNPADYEEQNTILTNEITDLRLQLQETRNGLTAAYADLEQEKLLDAKRSEYAAVCRELEDCRSHEPYITRLEDTIQTAVRAAPLAVAVEQLNEMQNDIRQTAGTITQKQAQLNTAETEIAALEAQKADRAQDEALKTVLSAGIPALEKAVILEQEVAEGCRQIRSIDEQAEAVQAALIRNAEAGAAAAAKAESLQNSIARLDEYDAAYQAERKLLEIEQQLLDTLCKLQKQETALKAHTNTKVQTEAVLHTAISDSALYTENIRTLEAEKIQAEQHETAAVLARTLQDGVPCPVCGSVEHPAPAEPMPRAFSFEERIAGEQRSLQRVQKEKEKAQELLAAEQAAIAQYEERIRELEALNTGLRAEHTEAGGSPFPDEETAARAALAQTARRTEQASAHYTDSRRAVRAKTAADAETARLQQERTHLEAERQRCSIERAAAAAAVSEKEKLLADTYTAIPEDIGGTHSAAVRLQQCKQKLEEIRRILEHYYARSTELLRDRDRITGELSAAQTVKAEREHAYTSKQSALLAECRANGFSSIEDLTAALCSDEDILRWKAEIKAFEERYITCRQSAVNLEKELAHTVPKDKDLLAETAARLADRCDEIQEQLERRTAEKMNRAYIYEQYTGLRQQLEVKTKEADIAIALSDELNGSNPKKLQFDTWILSTFLHEVTLFANKRLERMSKGRFTLTLSTEYGRGNSYKGLDLEITDSYTGLSRPSASLSGGETFMASISLALGLADSIQTRAGGIRIDSMFIDEGFGTLDERTLESAIDILDEIRGNRMVGIISHVGELQNRIPQKIEIVKTSTGSHIIEIPYTIERM